MRLFVPFVGGTSLVHRPVPVVSPPGWGERPRAEARAEGVETDRQLSELAALGCDAAQGYLFARPGPGADVAARIDRSGLAPLASRPN